jgi:O-antigen ligase
MNQLFRLKRKDNIAVKLGVGFILHVPLALLMFQYQSIGLLHMVLTIAIGLWLIVSNRKYERAAYVCAYIVGAEVLWRMTKTPGFWESGKYAASLLFLIAILRHKRFEVPILPIIYFVLLLPSLLIVFGKLGFEASRGEISFNLSGPLAIMMCALYFSQLRLTEEQFHRILLVISVPAFGIVTIALYHTLTGGEIQFANASNFRTSGGFGPNQVSSILGLAALVAFVYVLISRSRISNKAFLLGMTLLFATFSALTFSRGGLLTAATSGVMCSIFLLKNTRARLRFVLAGAVLLAGAYYVIVPRLDAFTNGAIISRFGNADLTGRDRIAMTDLRVWWDNPIFGVGPGMTSNYYESSVGLAPAHTEFSRMLSDHGLLGLVSIMLLTFMAIDNVKRARNLQHRAVVIGLLIWTLLFMMSSAMRLLAPAFVFGLTFARVVLQDPQYVRRFPERAIARHKTVYPARPAKAAS